MYFCEEDHKVIRTEHPPRLSRSLPTTTTMRLAPPSGWRGRPQLLLGGESDKQTSKQDGGHFGRSTNKSLNNE